jgi:hypothetical protein
MGGGVGVECILDDVVYGKNYNTQNLAGFVYQYAIELFVKAVQPVEDKLKNEEASSKDKENKLIFDWHYHHHW